MSFLNTVSGRITKAVDYIVEKNRKSALINRIRIVIKNERENEARAYVALGKYYFQNMRDPFNEETEKLCKSIENSDQRIKKAFDKLDEITACDEAEDISYSNCSGDCDYCSSDDYSNVQDFAQENEDYVDSNEYPLHLPIVDKANERSSAAEQAAEEADSFDDEDEEAADDEKGNSFV